MTGRFKSFPYGAVLFVFSVVIAFAMLLLLGFEWTQRQALREQGSQRVDSVTAPAFLLDREYLRYVSHLDLFLNARTPQPVEALRTRLDILFSKIETVRESPGSALLLENSKVAGAVEQMLDFARRSDAALLADKPDLAQLRVVLGEMQAFTADSLALGTAADLLGSRLLEQQTRDLLDQNLQITWLTLGQLLLLMLVAWGLVWRHRVQQREEKALKTLNEELRLAQQEAVNANLGKSLFLANMSHELRTPLNGVMGLLSLLTQTPLNSEQAELVKIANDSASHLLQLLNDILDMSALESGKISLRMESVHLPSFLRGIEATFQPLAAQKNLRFEMQNEVQEELWIESDSTRKRQILFNLINNAIKFTEQGQVSLVVRTLRDAQDKQWLELRVEDTGIGMDEEALGQLFQRFFQVDSGLSRKFTGAGLGLQISLSLARRLGGDITVQSQPRIGSIFTVRLPLVTRAAPFEQFAEHAPVMPVMTSVPTPDQAFRILVAEDHPVNRKFLSLLLERLGYTATFCENGEIALAALVSEDYDLVLMDIHMPVMDGLSATRAIRALANSKSQIPIIALTADVLQEARDQAQAAGVTAFIAKPVKQAELEPMIAQMVARRAAPIAPVMPITAV
jgi:signal transduction histidine kinase/CheY-like chemotaxis protein